jgi:hypothetical protein
VLAGGEDLETAGTALLERACGAFQAEEGAILLAEDAFVPGPSWGVPGHGGRLGTRRGDRELAADAAQDAVLAALLGLDRLGAPPGAAERLRATLTAERLGALRPVGASTS